MAFAGLLGASAFLMTWSMTVAGQNYPPDTVRQPLTAYVWPAIRSGDVARNAGMALELDGLWSLLPLAIILAVGLGLTARGLGETGASS